LTPDSTFPLAQAVNCTRWWRCAEIFPGDASVSPIVCSVIPSPDAPERRKTKPAVIQEIDRLLDDYTEEEIAPPGINCSTRNNALVIAGREYQPIRRLHNAVAEQ
jgi:hypothetical protein